MAGNGRGPNGTGSVFYEEARNRYRGVVSMPDGRKRSVTLMGPKTQKNERACWAKLHRLIDKIENGAPVPGAGDTVADAIAYWRRELPKRQLAPATISSYEGAIAHVEPRLGRVRLRDLSVQHVSRLLEQLADAGASRSLVSKVKKGLADVLRESQIRGTLGDRNVAKLARMPVTAKPKAKRALSVEEIRRVLDAARGERLEAFFVLALATGARRGELLALRWADVDLIDGVVSIRHGYRRAEGGGWEIAKTKTEASVRDVTIGPEAVAALRQHRKRQRAERLEAERWVDDDLVFTTLVGTPLDPSKLRRTWERIAERAGVHGTSIHELRHTVGSYLVESGHYQQAAQQLGHSVEVLIRAYVHNVRERVDLTAVTEELIAGAS